MRKYWTTSTTGAFETSSDWAPAGVPGERDIALITATGFPYTVQEKLEELVGLFAAFLSRSRAVRRLGSAALDICYVAAGRMDGFWEQGLNAWDIAAGVLLVVEAGGTITDLDGGPFDLRSGRIIATNGKIHQELRNVISEYYAGRA